MRTTSASLLCVVTHSLLTPSALAVVCVAVPACFCDHRKGKAVFKSDSMTAISIVKEVITKEATSKKVQINIALELREESVATFLGLLRSQMDHHFTLARRHSLVEALKEIATHEGADNLSFLTAEYQEIIRNADDIVKQYKAAPRHLDFLKGIITDLFVDKHKLSGKTAQTKIPGLLSLLDNYEFNKLLQYFKD